MVRKVFSRGFMITFIVISLNVMRGMIVCRPFFRAMHAINAAMYVITICRRQKKDKCDQRVRLRFRILRKKVRTRSDMYSVLVEGAK
jgi:hypothetical protein